MLCHIDRSVVAVTKNGEETRRWTAVDDGDALMAPNDASADGHGGVYLSDSGTFSRQARPDGRLLHLARDGRLRIVAEELRYPNGVFVDRRRQQLYVSEHMAGRVLRFEVDGDGSLTESLTFARVASEGESGPDGLELGQNGELYVAVYGEGRVLRFNRDGAVLSELSLPTPFATNVTLMFDGTVVTTGAFSNAGRELAGEVRFHHPSS